MKFRRDADPTDRCYFCRDWCGTQTFDRFAHWLPQEQRHIAISAHDNCFDLYEDSWDGHRKPILEEMRQNIKQLIQGGL